VIDAQVGFLNGGTVSVLPRIKNLVRAFVSVGAPVVFSRYHNYPGSPYERLLHWYKVRDSDDVRLVPDLDELTAHATVIDKTGYTVFVEDMDKLVAAAGCTDIVLCGVDTETCVLKSAVDAFERGLTPWIVRDACTSNGGTAMHRLGLRLARRFVGPAQVVRASELRLDGPP
jgi:nicotinamidase-related amidase